MMKIWEGTDVVLCYNVEDDDKTKRIRLVHLPEEPDPDHVMDFARLFINLLPATHSMDSIQILKRTRYV